MSYNIENFDYEAGTESLKTKIDKRKVSSKDNMKKAREAKLEQLKQKKEQEEFKLDCSSSSSDSSSEEELIITKKKSKQKSDNSEVADLKNLVNQLLASQITAKKPKQKRVIKQQDPKPKDTKVQNIVPVRNGLIDL